MSFFNTEVQSYRGLYLRLCSTIYSLFSRTNGRWPKGIESRRPKGKSKAISNSPEPGVLGGCQRLQTPPLTPPLEGRGAPVP